MSYMIMQGEDLFSLIPQRPPIVEIDTLYEASATEAHTGLTVCENNYFCEEGRLSEAGLIEHIAQSAAAFAGYTTYLRGEEPHLGFIGEIKKCKIYELPELGAVLHTWIEFVSDVNGVSLMKAFTTVDLKKIAECQIKIFLR